MKQLILFLALFFTIVSAAFSQIAHTGKSKPQAQFDSLSAVNRAFYLAGKLDSLPAINSKMLRLAQKIKTDSTPANAYGLISNYFFSKGDYAIYIEYTLKGIDYVQKGYQKHLAISYGKLAMSYVQLLNSAKKQVTALLRLIHNEYNLKDE